MSRRLQSLLRENWLLLLVVAVIGGGFVFLRTSESDVGSLTSLDERLANSGPTLLEFYSNG